MTDYKCPLCGRTMERNLVLYLDHTEVHIIDRIKVEHPEWVEQDGVCKPCAEYYKRQLGGESTNQNIGPQGRRRRFFLGVALLIVGFGVAAIFFSTGVGKGWRLLLFLPFFLALLGLIQAREKTCVVLAELGLRDLDSGEGKITNAAVAERLKTRGRGILVKSGLIAAALTAFFFLFP